MYKICRINFTAVITVLGVLVIIGLCFVLPNTVQAEEVQALDVQEQPVSTEADTYTVCLTFDDGPSPVTAGVLDVLKEYEVPGTFFVLGSATDYGLSMYRRMVDEGHHIGIHSYSHYDTIYSSFDAYREDFERLENHLWDNGLPISGVCRMPGGSSTTHCPDWLRGDIKSYLAEKGYTLVDWNIDPKDSGKITLTSDELRDNVIAQAQNLPNRDLIILMHDDGLRTTLPGALPGIIEYFHDNGYSFSTVGEDTQMTLSQN